MTAAARACCCAAVVVIPWYSCAVPFSSARRASESENVGGSGGLLPVRPEKLLLFRRPPLGVGRIEESGTPASGFREVEALGVRVGVRADDCLVLLVNVLP